MKTRVADKRRSVRVAAAHPAVVRGRRGRVLARGRTANLSQNGVFLIVRCPQGPPDETDVLLEMQVPTAASTRGKRPGTRSVSYRCRVVRTRTLGHLVGLGLEFVEKVG